MEEQHDKLEKLENKLYSRDPEAVPEKRFGILRPVYKKVESTWGGTKLGEAQEKKIPGIRGFRLFFFISLTFFVLAAGFVAYSIIKGPIFVSGENIEVEVLGNPFSDSGVTLPLSVSIVNKNGADLLDTVLSVEYPIGTTTPDGKLLQKEKREIGLFPAGGTKVETILPVLYGEEKTTRTIFLTLEYTLEGSQSRFLKKTEFPILLSSSPLALSVDGPTTISKGQPFSLIIKNTMSESASLKNAYVHIEYPNGFSFQSSTPEPAAGLTTWKLGDLIGGAYRAITIRGRIDADVGEERSFRIYSGTSEKPDATKVETVYNSQIHTVKIEESFLATKLVINGKEGDTFSVQNGDVVNGLLRWVHTGPVSISDPLIKLRIVGSSVDETSMKADKAVYNSFQKEIQWGSEALLTDETAMIEQGQSGTLPFSFKTLQTSGVAEDIVLTVSIEGTSPDRGYEKQVLSGIEEKTVRFSSRLQFSSQAVHSIGAFTNTGPFPPKVNTKTTYTIIWSVLPSENTLENAQLSAVLPEGVEWNKKIAPEGARISYNPENRTVTWNIGPLVRTSSTNNKSISAAFQIAITPALGSDGKELTLLGPTTYTATDTAIKASITDEKAGLTTRLVTDPAYSGGDEIVLP
jgi:hypothetical protein